MVTHPRRIIHTFFRQLTYFYSGQNDEFNDADKTVGDLKGQMASGFSVIYYSLLSPAARGNQGWNYNDHSHESGELKPPGKSCRKRVEIGRDV